MLGGERMLKIDEENNIYLTRGDTAILDVELTDPQGLPYTMKNNEYLFFTVRKIAGKGECVISKKCDTQVIYLVTNDTKDLSFGEYMYDLYLFNESSLMMDTFLAEKKFTIGEEVHVFE